MRQILSPAEVDFWLDAEKYSNYLSDKIENANSIFNIDLIRLSAIRRSISNFVRILTRKNIPVYFDDTGESRNLNGDIIYISSEINSKFDFDVAVGLALHEGAHSIKTDFDVLSRSWANIPHNIFVISDKKNIRRPSIEDFIRTMFNIIEDRYIDNYVFNSAPGYRGYYIALYDKFFNDPLIDQYILGDEFRFPSLKSYKFRIGNITNKNTDLLALPRLDDVAKLIDLSNIDRLKTTEDRVDVAFKVVEVVLDCLDKNADDYDGGKAIKVQIAKPQDYFDFGDNEEEVDVGKKIIEEIIEVNQGNSSDPENLPENKDIVSKISTSQLDPFAQKEIKGILKKQEEFLRGDIPKTPVSSQAKDLLDLIEKHGIIIERVETPAIVSGNTKNLKIDCIVVQKMTKELITSGQDVFPLCGCMQMNGMKATPNKEVNDAVNKGISIGRKLGRKLQIINEINIIKEIRKKRGKINKRQLHEAAFDATDLFYKTNIEFHNKATLHITVDASSSMNGRKWHQTMTAVVAICKAMSMIDNVHVTISFRTTQMSARTNLPYVVLAYDSKIDKFSKVKNLFPYLVPNGTTPEGLAFGAIMNLFEDITPDQEDRYFLNLSDGEPWYSLVLPHAVIAYCNEVGTTHTKHQVDKIRKYGVNILSYFIYDDYEYPELKNNFSKMYGPDAKFIDVESIVDLAYTINKLFLNGGHEKSS